MKISGHYTLLLICLNLVVCLNVNAEPKGFPTSAPLRFLILGDAGTGGLAQATVAQAMETVCAERGCQFALNAGDNIYEFGPSKDSDESFIKKFEKPFAKLNFPFFMALGNHDQSGIIPGSGVHPQRGDIEVEYTKRSTKWMMPKRYYEVSLPVKNSGDYTSGVKDPILDVFVIDTNLLAPQNVPQFDWYRPGREYDLGQRSFLRKGISKSHAKWKVVLGHHPYINNGRHGSSGHFFGFGLARGEELKKMYEAEVCGKVDLLITGHDHSLQFLKAKTECGARPAFIVSGAAAKSNGPIANEEVRKENPAEFEAYETNGFFWAEATSQSLSITAYTVDHLGVAKKAFEKVIKK